MSYEAMSTACLPFWQTTPSVSSNMGHTNSTHVACMLHPTNMRVAYKRRNTEQMCIIRAVHGQHTSSIHTIDTQHGMAPDMQCTCKHAFSMRAANVQCICSVHVVCTSSMCTTQHTSGARATYMHTRAAYIQCTWQPTSGSNDFATCSHPDVFSCVATATKSESIGFRRPCMYPSSASSSP